MNRKLLLVLVVFLLITGWYGLSPMATEAYTREMDLGLLQGKQDYLTETVTGDTLLPNILWIVVDDLGYYDTDLYGPGMLKTPQLGRLAQEGTTFSRAYVTSPICSPSRAALLTGRYNQRFGFEHQLHERYLQNRLEYYAFKYILDSDPWTPQFRERVPEKDFIEKIGMPRTEITIAEALKAKGYRTGLIGKWHVTKDPTDGPNALGFDEFYGFYSSHSLYSPEGSPGIVDVKNDRDWTDDYIWSGQRERRHAIQRNGTELNETRYLTTAIADESIDFLKRHDPEEPFFLVASFNAPHTPFQAPQSYMDPFADEPDPIRQVYKAMIRCLDDEIGRILDFLEQKELMDNTMICLVSDNGGAAYTHATDNGALKGGKITNFEGGIRVPMLIRWPGQKDRSTYDIPVSAMDLFTSSLAVAGLAPPADRPIDGVDLKPFLSSEAVPHPYLFYRKGYNHAVVTPTSKLIWNSFTQSDTLLYALSDDPGETANLYEQETHLIAPLLEAYRDWSRTLREPAWPSVIHFALEDDDGTTYLFDN